MIDYLIGTIKAVHEKSVTVLADNLGFLCHTPQAAKLVQGKKIELFTHLHWNQEKGPSLYGFETELERTTFIMIIGCPKIGPSIALTILSQIPAPQFLEIITSQNETALSAINGIGPKKAKQIAFQLKGKITFDDVFSEPVPISDEDGEVIAALTTLGYSIVEAQTALQNLPESAKSEAVEEKIRIALTGLAKL